MGCSLSPLMGAIYLSELDQAFTKKPLDKVQYFRHQDDYLVLAKYYLQIESTIEFNSSNDLYVNIILPVSSVIGRMSALFFREYFN